MARPAGPAQFSALQKIRAAIAEHGDELGPRMARADFPGVPAPTWSRWVKQVRDEDLFGAHQPTPVALVPPDADLLQAAELVMGPAGVLDFFSQVGAMTAACDALTDYAWPRDPASGVRKVRNPVMLERATRLRVTVLDLAHRRDEAVWNVERMRAFQSDLMDALKGSLAGDDSGAAMKVLGALRTLEARIKARARYLGSPEAIENIEDQNEQF